MPRLNAPVQTLIAIALAGGATGLCLWLDPRMSVAGLAMVYLAAVVAAGMVLGRAASIATSLLCVSALNYFFVPPRYSFDIDGAEYWWTLAVLLGVSLAMQTLIAVLREGRERAELGEARAAQLHALSEALAQCKGHAAMARCAADWLHRTQGFACAVYEDEPGETQPRCWPSPPDAQGFHARAARWAMEHGRPVGRGCDDWPELPLWCGPFGPRGSTGAVQLLIPGPERPAPDLLAHWQSLAHQVGLSVERERAGETARQAQDSARAEAARNTLLASLSHDLRTPLAGIVGSASALRAQGEAMSGAQRERLLANLEDEARDMTLMADNVLQMARLSQPHSQLALQWESIEEILGAVMVRMRRRWGLARIRLSVAADLPPVQAEAGLLAQVVANLVDNAVRHGGDAPRVAIQAGRSRAGVFIAVRDHGSGIPTEQLEALFDRYRRGAGQRRPEGAGLGLAICRLVVEAHGGTIDARACDPGVEFRIDLPARAREAARG